MWLTPGMMPKMKPIDRAAADRGRRLRADPCRRGHEVAEFRPDRLDGLGLLQVEQDLGDAEQADRQRREGQAVGEAQDCRR